MTNVKEMGMNLLGKHVPDLRGMCAYYHQGSYRLFLKTILAFFFCMEASRTVADLGRGMRGMHPPSLCVLFMNNILRRLFGLEHQDHQGVSVFT